ncbi:MAG: Uncharacterized protein G01um101466_713 [Parcubacteria group bacterium Gr01-1014_66]|nr:MAG: Uncharacterized protein G01um101466_713 [Parcubacteria group bacterium Gr01-1014_66]
MKAVLFARVSSREQEETGYSLDSQVKLLQDYAEKRAFDVAKTYRISESASGRQIRKTFNEMLQYTTDHKTPIILCEKIDRLTRNLKDAAVADEWVKGNPKREIHFVKESFVLNQNTKAHENLVWDMKVAIARFYTNNLSEEVKKGFAEKIRQGWMPTKPPLGYKTIGEAGHKIHVMDEGKVPFIRRMFELYATGNYSLNALVDVLYQEGLRTREGKKLMKSRMHTLLSDPFYHGSLRWNKEIFPAQHEALITKELFDVVQQKLTRKIGSPRYKKHLPVFKAKINCEECGATITWEIQKGHWYGHHSSFEKYRNCTKKRYIRQEQAEEQLFPYFDKVAPMNRRILQWIEKALKESHGEEVQYNTSRREQLTRIIQVSDRRIEEAYKDKLDGKMPSALCEKVMQDATREKEEALQALQRLSKARSAYYEAGYAIHELAAKAKDIYRSPKATSDEKRLLLSYVFSNLTINADKITPNYTFAFQFLAEWVPKLNSIFEPQENRTNKRQTADFSATSPEILRGLDSNQDTRLQRAMSCR